MNNNHNHVWHVTGYFDVEENSSSEVTFEIFDEDVGKDDFLGKATINIHEVCEAKDFVNKWIPLENCKSGKILISAKCIPLKRINRAVGHVSLTIHKAKKIEKKNMMKKADPYVLIKLGREEFKSQTVSNSIIPPGIIKQILMSWRLLPGRLVLRCLMMTLARMLLLATYSWTWTQS